MHASGSHAGILRSRIPSLSLLVATMFRKQNNNTKQEKWTEETKTRLLMHVRTQTQNGT